MSQCTKNCADCVQSRNRIHTTKTQIGSVALEIKAQVRMLRMSAALQKSTKVMESMNALVDLRSVSATMNQLSREMAKAGVIEEMIEEVRVAQSLPGQSTVAHYGVPYATWHAVSAVVY